MPAVGPGLDMERAAGRSADRCVGEAFATGLEGAGGEDGEGLSKGVSESKSASGVEAADAMASSSNVYVAASGAAGYAEAAAAGGMVEGEGGSNRGKWMGYGEQMLR